MKRGVPARIRRLPDRFASEVPVARGSSRLPRVAGMAPHVAVPRRLMCGGSLLHCVPPCLQVCRSPGPAPQRRSPDEGVCRTIG